MLTTDDFFTYNGVALSHDVLCLVIEDRDNDPSAIEDAASAVLIWRNGRVSPVLLDWRISAISCAATNAESAFAIGHFGELALIAGGIVTEGKISNAADRTSRYGHLRSVALGKSELYIAGMGRQVYRANDPIVGPWTSMADPILISSSEDAVRGFNCLAAFGKNEIYAAGWEGEVYRYQDGQWYDCHAPTNAILNDLACSHDSVFVVGLGGTIIKGHSQHWEAIIQDETDTDFWSAVWFEDALWVASMNGVFRLTGDLLESIKLPVAPEELTTGRLTASGRRIWSIGSDHVFFMEPGRPWQQIFI